MEKFIPCDITGSCPYEAYQGNTCRDICGVGVDEACLSDCDYDYDEECDV